MILLPEPASKHIPAESITNDCTEDTVTALGEVDSIFCGPLTLGVFCQGSHEIPRSDFQKRREIHKPRPALLRQLLNGFGILGEKLVVLGGVGEAGAAGAQVFVPDGAEQDEAHRGLTVLRLSPFAFRLFHNRVHELAEFLFEPRGGHRLRTVTGGVGVERGVAAFVREFLQAGGHAVAEEDDRGLHQIELLAEPLPALGRRIEAGARNAEWGVAGKAEIAHGEGAVGELLVHPRFQITVSALALQQRIAEEKHAVAGEDLERRGRGRGRGREESEGPEEAEEQGDGAHGEGVQDTTEQTLALYLNC